MATTLLHYRIRVRERPRMPVVFDRNLRTYVPLVSSAPQLISWAACFGRDGSHESLKFARSLAAVTCDRCCATKAWRSRAVLNGVIPHAWVTSAIHLMKKHEKTESDVLWVANRSGGVSGSWAEWVESARIAPTTGDVIVGDGWWIVATSILHDFEDSVTWQWREPPVWRADPKTWAYVAAKGRAGL